MKLRLYVDQPTINMKAGIAVKKDTEFLYRNENVEQVVKDLIFETIKREKGSNGINSYESKSYIKIQLNEGDVLLFDEHRGYYLPAYPVTSIEDAISDISSLEEFADTEVDESELVKKEATADDTKEDIKGNEEGCS